MIYSSNHLEYLCQRLAGKLGQRNGSIFGREIIITQSAGMTAWLKTGLANRIGIIANTGFMNQDALLNEIYLFLSGVKPKNNKDFIKYKVYILLGGEDFKGDFPGVAGYYSGSELRRVQLAGRIADLFDQYQLYRPEMIRLWEEDKLTNEAPEAEKWQQWLWKRVMVESRATVRDNLIKAMQGNGDRIRNKFPAISLFGITIFTEFHLKFFKELSKYTQVDFYLCLPTDKKPYQNELLLSFGFKAEELVEMVEDNLGKFEYTKQKNAGNTSLAGIQDQILNNSENLNFTDDGSVQINSCYTPVREVECLYNYLLDLFDKDRSLKPGDVLVMTTDINKYSPFVKAVFKNAPVNIPLRVSGAANNSEDSMVSAIEQILRFTEDDLTSEKVVSLLEQKRIKQRFRVSDCDYIRSVVRKANIRFGRENRAEDDTRYVSWNYGLQKILLGYAMLTDEEYRLSDDLTLFPYKDAEASESHDLFRLKAFVERLGSVIDEESTLRTMAEWKKFLFEEVVEKMVYHDDFDKDDRAELSAVYRSLSFIDSLEFGEKVPFEVFLDELDSKLFTESGEMHLNTGNVTVSAPVPVRGIPFRVICFLGLGNDVFPRKDKFMGFDLLGEAYLEGDRNKKETDKYLFLDTILSARKKLYLSYIGQNVKDNTEFPPSIIVDTFYDYLDAKTILQKHPMHGFSSVYNNPDDPRMFTYLYGGAASGFTVMKKVEKEIREAQIKSLIDFFQAPVEWYFKYILSINYDDQDDILDETEIFELDNLQKWIIRKKLLGLKEEELELYLEKGKKEGILPLKTAAIVSVESIKKEIEYILPAYRRLTGEREEHSVVIDTEIDNIRVTGTIDGIFDKEFVAYSVSKHPLKYKIEAYIKALLLFEAGEIDSAKFVDREGVITGIPAGPGTAKADLEELIRYYKAGSVSPVLFTISAAEKALALYKNDSGDEDGGKKQKILEIFEKEASPEDNSRMPENPYLQVLFRENRFDDFGEKEIETIIDFAGKLKLLTF
jgi:exodeoxyribonuclease V gamma subunit